jgi:hypothetical protein
VPLLSSLPSLPPLKDRKLPLVRYGVSWFRGELADRRLIKQGQNFGRTLPPSDGTPQPPGELARYVEAHVTGPGIHKWKHYLPIYERHLAHLRGRQPRLVEIGVASGGSLQMWRDYLGPTSHIIGVDIAPVCKTYEQDGITIEIGSQGDPDFWRRFVAKHVPIDAVIDDGSHKPEHQILTLKMLLPHLRPGGVYICEDVHGTTQRFHRFIDGLTRNLDAGLLEPSGSRELKTDAGPFQNAITGVHRYAFMTVLERAHSPVGSLESVRRGSEWAAEDPS